MWDAVTWLIIVGGACWALRQWLGHLERRPAADEPARDQGGAIRPARPWEIERHPAPADGPLRARRGGAGKWIVMALCALYIVWPIDLLPDFIPVLGWGDDVAAAVIGLRQLFK